MTGIDPSKTYTTGKPCKRGHLAPRQLSNKTCTECARLAYHKNGEARRAGMKSWREANPDKMKAASKRWKDQNREVCQAHHRKRRARKAMAEGAHTAADVAAILAKQRGRCANCLKVLTKYHADHIVPLARGGDNWPSNIQCLCPGCNFRKHKKMPEEWAAANGRLL